MSGKFETNVIPLKRFLKKERKILLHCVSVFEY